MSTPDSFATLDDELDAAFRQFYAEVEGARAQAPETEDPVLAEQAALQVQRHLQNLIELQDAQSRRGRADAVLAEQVRYLKAAFADEILLNRPWAGRGVWERYLLEAALFRTSVAGEKVISRIHQLLSDREPGTRALARLYLFVLALGFEGRLRGEPEADSLRALRLELFQFVFQRSPGADGRDRVLWRQPYAHTVSHLAPRRRRTVSRWVLVLDEGHSASPLPLAQSGIASALGMDASGPASIQGLSWNFFDKGVVIDVVGAYLGGGEDDDGATKPWDEFLGLCRDYRPERPFDAFVLTIPAALLLDPHPNAQIELVRLARRANRRLWLAQNRFAMRFGIYVVLSGCEQVEGFSAFAKSLPEWLRGNMLGWSSPYDIHASYRGDWVGEAMAETIRALSESTAELFAGQVDAGAAASLFLLPTRVAALRAALQGYLDELMRPSSYHEPFLLRGIYCTGDADAVALPPGEAPDAMDLPPGGGSLDIGRQPVFLRDLFEQKVFSEIGLTRPSATQSLGRPLAQRALRWGLWGSAACWSLGLAVSTVLVHTRSARLDAALRQIAVAEALPRSGFESASTVRAQDRQLVALMAAIGRLDERKLWSVFMPGSWPIVDPLSGQVRTTLQRRFATLSWRALRRGLEQHASELTGVPTDPVSGELIADARCAAAQQAGGGASPTLGFESLPEFQQWRDFLLRGADLDRALHALQGLQDSSRPARGADLRLLVRVALGIDANGNLDHAAALLQRFADGRGGIDPAPLRSAMQCRQAQLLDALQTRAFSGNPLVGAVRAVDTDVGRIENLGGYATVDDALRLWHALQQRVQGLEALLARGGGGWIASPAFAPGPVWNKALAGIAASSLLGPQVARSAHESAEAGFQSMRAALAAASADDTTLGVDWDPKTLRWTPNPEMASLGDALRALFALPWIGRSGDYAALEAPDGSLLSWDPARLNQALGAGGEGKHFQTTLLLRFPDSLRDPLQSLVDAQLAGLVSDQLAAALTPGGADPATSSPAQYAKLGRIHDLLQSLGANTLAGSLDRLLQRDAAARLRRLSDALRASRLYTPQGGNFDRWQGGEGPALAAFDVPDLGSMNAYLDAQRSRVETLSARAQQLLHRLDGHGSQQDRWRAIGDDLKLYALKSPDSSLGSLQDFLRAMSGDVDTTNCAAAIAKADAPPGNGDYFALREQQLASSLARRCALLRTRAFDQGWQQFASRFNRQIAGRPPYARPGWKVADATVDVDELAALAPAFEPLSRMLRQMSVGAHGGAIAPLRGFAQAFSRSLAWMRPLMPGDSAPAPGYDVRVAFRTHRAHEVEGNQFIDWSIDIGDQHLDWSDPPRTLHWVPGQPVTLHWRLASDSPLRLLAGSGDPALHVAGDSASLRYTDRWSLLNLLASHRPRGIGDPKPLRGQPVVVDIPIQLPALHPGAPPRRGFARLYLSLGLSAAGAHQPLRWPGEFPTHAPLAQAAR